jgi:hypothetical protein
MNESVETLGVEKLPEDVSIQLDLQGKDKNDWKLEKVRYLVQIFPECQLSLPFFNPFLKSNKALFTYRLLMQAF